MEFQLGLLETWYQVHVLSNDREAYSALDLSLNQI
jgi:hypothetical protein